MNETSVHAVAGLLKLFFRQTPSPLFPHSVFDDLVAVPGMALVEGVGPVQLFSNVVSRNGRR